VYGPPMTFTILSDRWVGNTGCPAKSSTKGGHPISQGTDLDYIKFALNMETMPYGLTQITLDKDSIMVICHSVTVYNFGARFRNGSMESPQFYTMLRWFSYSLIVRKKHLMTQCNTRRFAFLRSSVGTCNYPVSK
jgi:hypothetical protein